jgi:hypothetical protein
VLYCETCALSAALPALCLPPCLPCVCRPAWTAWAVLLQLVVEYTGFEVLGSQLSQDGSSCSVDARATYKRLVSADRQAGRPHAVRGGAEGALGRTHPVLLSRCHPA